MNKLQLLLKCTGMVLKSGVCPETPVADWPKLIMFAHSKGYLYVSKDTESFVCAYRIPEFTDNVVKEMPEKESGDILFIAWAASNSTKKTSLLRMLRSYLKENQIKEIIYLRQDRNGELKRIQIKELVHE